jgi:hypothetical protein
MRFGYRPAALAVLVSTGVLIATATAAGAALPAVTRVAGAVPEGPNLIRNADFKNPAFASPCPDGGASPAAGVCTYSAGSTAIPHWSIGGDGIALVSSTFWQPARGSQSIALSANGPGSVTQRIHTVVNRRYLLKWAASGNPDCGPPAKRIWVYWNGVSPAGETIGSGASNQNMRWGYARISIKAKRRIFTLKFVDATTPDQGVCGAALGYVSLRHQKP